MTLNKNNHIALILTVLVFLLKLGVCYSQHSIDVTHISLVVYNKKNTELRLFEEKDKNQFVEVYLEFDSNFDNNFISTNIEQDHMDHALTLEDIKRNEDDVLLHIDNLRDLNSKDVKKHEYEIIENWYKYGEKTNALVLKFLNNQISTIQELSFQKREQNVGIGTHVLTKDDTEDRWSVNYTNYFATVDLNFGNNKHIYLLLNHDYINYIFLPLINTNYLISDNNGISALKPTSKYKTSYKENFERLDFENFTSIIKHKSNTYELVNSFQENLLNATYDTIMYNQFFIIGKHKGQVDIFNSLYEKIKIDSIKSAYLYRSGLEILNHKGANYYDSDLNIVEKFPPLQYLVCGTVNSTSYKIGYDTSINTAILTKTYGGFASNLDEKREYYLKGLKRKDKVTFLNNNKELYWDNNDDYIGSTYEFPHLLKITRRKKRGIIEYDYNNNSYALDTISKDWKKEVIFLPEYLEGNIVLPVNNDSITFNKTDGLIYFYRKNKIGIFPRHTTVQFDHISQKTNSFYAIIRDDKKGWLDIQTNMEYFDN